MFYLLCYISMSNFLSSQPSFQSSKTYEELCDRVKKVFDVVLPEKMSDINRDYIGNTFGIGWIDDEQQWLRSEVWKIANNAVPYYWYSDFTTHNLVQPIQQQNHYEQPQETQLLIQQSEKKKTKQEQDKEIEFPYSYMGYRYEVQRVLHQTLPHKHILFTKEELAKLLKSQDKKDNVHLFQLADRGKFFVTDYTEEERVVINAQKTTIPWRKKSWRWWIGAEKSHQAITKNQLKKEEKKNDQPLVQQAPIIVPPVSLSFLSNNTNNPLANVVEEINKSDINYVSESNYKHIQWFLKKMLSRSDKEKDEDSLESVIDMLDKNLITNSYWRTPLKSYIIGWKINLKEVKRALQSLYPHDTNIYKYLLSFRLQQQKNT